MPPIVQRKFEIKSSVIPIGTPTGGSFKTSAYSSGLVEMPAAFTGANLSFLVSKDNVLFQPLLDPLLGLITIGVTAGNTYPLPKEVFYSFYCKPVSDQNEAAARTLYFMLGG